MATNRVVKDVTRLSLAASDPATPASGDPVRVGAMTGVAIVKKGDGGNSSTQTTVDVSNSAWNLSVAGVNAGGNSAVAIGDALYYVDADTPKLSKKVAGTFFGYALGAVTSGATATIEVLHVLKAS